MKSAAALAGITVAAEDLFIANSVGPKPQDIAYEERGHWTYGITWDVDSAGWGVSPK